MTDAGTKTSRLQPIKRWLRSWIPSRLWAITATTWHLAKTTPLLCAQVLKGGWPHLILHFGSSPGDDLLCTVVARELKQRGARSLWMASYHPTLFAENPDIACVFTPGPWLDLIRKRAPEIVPSLGYSNHDPVADIGTSPDRHILEIMSAAAGVHGTIKLRPRMHLSKEELRQQEWASGCLAIQSSGLQALSPMLNKQWQAGRFQEICTTFAATCPIVQLGLPGDPPLAGAIDMRGRTSLRETAAILSHARLYIGTVGLLMHLARAVDCRSVIIYGGRERPEQTGYTCNINLATDVPCSPCWRYNACDHQRMCMDAIDVSAVASAINECLRQPHGALVVDTIHVN